MSAPRPPAPGLFEEILSAPDREQIPGARPVLSYHEDDEPDFLAAIDARARARFELRRRGVSHGRVAELEDVPEPRLNIAHLRKRWVAARPVFLPGAVRAGLEEFELEIEESLQLATELRRPGGLARWLRSRADLLPEDLVVSPRRTSTEDPERDIEKVLLSSPGAKRRGSSRDLWLKSTWLSAHPDDESLRLRFSFGREVADDASGDPVRCALVAEVAAAMLPEEQLVSGSLAIQNLLQSLTGDPVLFTQHIAYWNTPEGGALFHHDAFPADERGVGQLGVVFAQLVGRTLWLALPIVELAERVRELSAYLVDGQLPWLREELFPRTADLDALLARVNDHGRLMRELALPGCGALGAIVNRGPEFTSLLCDAGHAVVLEPGDVLLLPNHGYGCTAMHSVFCASDSSTYGISFAVRSARPRAPVLPPAAEAVVNGPEARIPRRRRRRGG